MVLAYLVMHHDMDLAAAVAMVKARRDIRPNNGFLAQLVALETKCEEVLANNISIENCTEVMIVANKINNSRLRDACLQFGIMNMNRISGKSSKLFSSPTLMLLQSFTRQRPRKSRGKVSTVISTGKDHVDETAGSAVQHVDDGSDSGDRVQMEMEDVDTRVGARGTLDDDEEEAGDNGSEVDTDQGSVEENEDNDDEASDRNERLLLQVYWVTWVMRYAATFVII